MLIQKSFDFSIYDEVDYSKLPRHIHYHTESLPPTLIPNLIQETKQTKEVFIDIETYSDLPFGGLCYWLGDIRLIQLAIKKGETHIFDLKKLPSREITLLKGFLRNVLGNKEIVIVAHNAMFELTWLYNFLDIRIAYNVKCTMVMSMCRYHGAVKSWGNKLRHGLKDCLRRELGIDISKQEQTSDWGRNNLTLAQIQYAATDVDLVIPLYQKLKEDIFTLGCGRTVFVECESLVVFAKMSLDGMPINIEHTKKAIAWHEAERAKYVTLYRKDFPTEPFYGSTLGKSIYQVIKTNNEILNKVQDMWRAGAVTDGSFDSSVLSVCAEAFPSLHALSEIRTLDKHLNYLKAMLINERKGRVHSHYRSLTSSSFGRSTSGAVTRITKAVTKATQVDPAVMGINLQNPPKPYNHESEPFSVRSCFPLDVISDLSAAHSKIAVELSQDKVSMDIENNGGDIHLFTAATLEKMMGGSLTFEDMMKIKKDKTHKQHKHVKKLRSLSKNVRYSSFNLGGAARLQKTCEQQGLSFTIDECKAAIKAWRQVHKDIYDFQMKTLYRTNQGKLITFPDSDFPHLCNTNCLGGKVYLPASEGKFSRGKLEVNAADCMSFQWMSVEAYVMKKAMVLIHRTFQDNPAWQAEIVNLAHDELNAICGNKEYREEVAKTVFTTMDQCMKEIVKSIPTTQDTWESCLVETWLDK